MISKRFMSAVRLPLFNITKRWFKVGKSPRRDEIIQVAIEGLDKNGNGVTTIEWDTMQKQIEPTKLVVRGALPGETVRVRVISVSSKGGSAVHTVKLNVFGRREHIIRPRLDHEPWRSTIEPELLPPGHEESPDYQPFDCPHFSRRHDEEACRGCSVPHLNYTRQMIEKTKLLRQSLRGAVEDDIMSALTIEPRSSIKRFSDKIEVFAFANRPMETPVWGQLSYENPLPGERRNKHFIPTPNCRLMTKSAQAVLNRLSDLVAIAHSESPGLFSVYDEVIDRGYLRSAVIQSTKNRDGNHQVLLSLVTATEPSRNFKEKLKTLVVDRLMQEFPLLKGVVLIEARPSRHRDFEFFNDPSKVQLLAGQSCIPNYIEAIDREILVGPSSTIFDTEVSGKLISAIGEAIGKETIPVLELFTGDGSVTPILKELSNNVKSLNERELQFMLQQDVPPEQLNASPLLPSSEIPLDKAPIVRQMSEIPNIGEKNDVIAVISFPQNDNAKPEVKGVTPKEFRHWLGNTVKPKRIVMMTDKFDGLRKDIGHMRLLGYELKTIRAFDIQPGRMDKIATLVVMDRKPKYEPLSQEQLIE